MRRLPPFMLSRSSIALFSCCLWITLLLPSAAWADATDEALRLNDQANDLIEQMNGRYDEVMDLWYTVSEIIPGTAEAAGAAPVLEKVAAGVNEMLPKAMSVVDLYDEAIAMDIDPDLKTWLGMRQEVAVLRWHELRLLSDSVAKTQTLYGQWAQLSPAERDELYADLDENYARDRKLVDLAKSKQDDADKYAADAGLDGSSPWYLSEWFLSLVALVLLVAPATAAWIRRRRRPKGEPEWV